MRNTFRRKGDVEELIFVLRCVGHVVGFQLLLLSVLALAIALPYLISVLAKCWRVLVFVNLAQCRSQEDSESSALMTCTSESFGVGADIGGLSRGIRGGLASCCFGKR